MRGTDRVSHLEKEQSGGGPGSGSTTSLSSGDVPPFGNMYSFCKSHPSSARREALLKYGVTSFKNFTKNKKEERVDTANQKHGMSGMDF